MSKPAPPAAAGEVVEIDAIDVQEWEQHQRTPQASDANLAALVRESAIRPEPALAEAPRARARVTAAGAPRPARRDTAPIAQRAPRSSPSSRRVERSERDEPPRQADRIELVAPGRLARAGSPTLERTIAPSITAPAMPVAAPPTLTTPATPDDVLNHVTPRAEARPEAIVLPLSAPAESAPTPSLLGGRDPAPPASLGPSGERPGWQPGWPPGWPERTEQSHPAAPPAQVAPQGHSKAHDEPGERRDAPPIRGRLPSRRLLALGAAAGGVVLIAVLLVTRGGEPAGVAAPSPIEGGSAAVAPEGAAAPATSATRPELAPSRPSRPSRPAAPPPGRAASSRPDR
ncbi:MAG TPA: hypothetical protein VFT22_29285, partial [Kofleriaceae bacterium]|nr:hypothetical protein [Kofleriaceae bacterium]